MAVIYRVSLDVEAEIAEEFRTWLQGHVDEMLKLPGFLGARILEDLDLDGRGGVRLHAEYRIKDRPAFDAYLSEHADRMRQEGQERFGGQFKAGRELSRIRSDVRRG